MKSFLNNNHTLITPLLQSQNEEDLLREIKDCIFQGADAIGVQIERLPSTLRTEEKFKKLFSAAGEKPIYVTCYQRKDVAAETDEQRKDTLLLALKAGATMADIRGDMFCPCEGELTFDENAVNMQKKLIEQIHEMGKEVLISSHVIYNDNFVFLKREEVYKIALEQQKRGADMAKIVTNADTEEELEENFKTFFYLKEKLNIPAVFLCNGKMCLKHRLAGVLIGEPIVFAREKSYVFGDSPQLSIVVFKKIRDNAL
jgi:3-dehydroquinate dehydratase